jgi:hypothetical protein
MKEFEIIKAENYLFVCDNDKIEEFNWYIEESYCDDEKVVILLRWDGKVGNPNKYSHYKNIIGHLPLNNAPILEGVPLLPELVLEDDVERLINQQISDFKHDLKATTSLQVYFEGAIFGLNRLKKFYKAATKVYSEEDLKGFCKFYVTNQINSIWDSMELYVQSLQQPKYPTRFVAETEVGVFGNHISFDANIDDYIKLKTTTNSQGQKVLCGNYK